MWSTGFYETWAILHTSSFTETYKRVCVNSWFMKCNKKLQTTGKGDNLLDNRLSQRAQKSYGNVYISMKNT